MLSVVGPTGLDFKCLSYLFCQIVATDGAESVLVKLMDISGCACNFEFWLMFCVIIK